MNVRQHIATEKRKLGTLPAEECGGCALARLHFGCTIAAMEVAGLGNYENRHKDWEGFKHIADAVGIKECKRWKTA